MKLGGDTLTNRPYTWQCTRCMHLLKARRDRRDGGPCTRKETPGTPRREAGETCQGTLMHLSRAYLNVGVKAVFWDQQHGDAPPEALLAAVLAFEASRAAQAVSEWRQAAISGSWPRWKP